MARLFPVPCSVLPPFKEKQLNVKKPSPYILFAFLAGLVIGLALWAFGSGISGSANRRELRERLEQVNRDLNAAIDSQREAERRASRLQEELQGIADHARSLEEGTGRAEGRAGNLAQQLNGIINQNGELADGINRASGSLEESRILINELGILLRSLPEIGR